MMRYLWCKKLSSPSHLCAQALAFKVMVIITIKMINYADKGDDDDDVDFVDG